MAVGAVDAAEITDVDRMLENPRGVAFIEDGVTELAVLADPLPVRANVLIVGTAETSQRRHMADVVRVRGAVDAHLRATRDLENLLESLECTVNGCLFGL